MLLFSFDLNWNINRLNEIPKSLEISLFKNVFNILVCGVEEDAGQGDGLLETQIYSNDETTVQVAKRDRNVFLCYARSGATRGGGRDRLRPPSAYFAPYPQLY